MKQKRYEKLLIMIKYIRNKIKAFATYIDRHFHFFHSYELVGEKFIGAYLPDFMDEEGLQTFLVCQNGKCNKCGKGTQYKIEIKGDHNLTQEAVEKLYPFMSFM